MPDPSARPNLKLFLSTVTSEFGSYRGPLRTLLTRPNVEVKVQEDFIHTGGSTVQKLCLYIEQCQAVVHLAGDRTGSYPSPHDEQELRASLDLTGCPPRLRDVLGPAGPPLSYTQWEAYLALYHRWRPGGNPRLELYLYTPSPTADRDTNDPAPDSERDSQTEHLERLKSLERFAVEFRNLDHLSALLATTSLQELLPHSGPVRRPVALPYPSIGTLFKGRDEFLDRLRTSLRSAGAGRATAIAGKALHGLGGVGKTRLAVEYAWRHEADYTAVLFVTADSSEALRANLAALSGPLVLNLPEHAAPEEEARLAAALRWLDDHPGWFLILDNVDTPEAAEAAEDLLAKLHGGQVLITGRLTQWGAAVEPLELDVLDAAPAAEFLLQRASHRRKLPSDNADAATLADELDGLALALEQAGAYVNAQRISLADYLRAWRAHEPAVQEWYDPRITKYPRSVAVTWQTTMDRLGPGEATLLCLLSWLAPEPLPMWVFESEEAESLWQSARELQEQEAATGSHDESTQPIESSPSPSGMERGGRRPGRGLPRDAVLRLADYGMVRFHTETETVSVHRVVQEIVRARLPEDQRPAWLTLSLRLVDAAMPGDPGDVRTWPKWESLRPHVAVAADHGEAAGIADPTSNLLNQLGRLLLNKALHAESEPLFGRALAIDETSFGPEHPNVAIRLNNLAQLLQATNRLADAEPLMRRALAIDERSFGLDHTNVATDLNNLAILLYHTGRVAGAEPMMRRALTIRTRFGLDTGHAHPHLRDTRQGYTTILQALGRSAKEIQAELAAVEAECRRRKGSPES